MHSAILLDANNTFYRADCVTDLHDALGNRVSGVFGMLRILQGLMERFKPNEVIVVWDGGHSPARKLLYPEYKQKPPTKEEDKDAAEQRRRDFYSQIADLNEHLPMFGVRQIKLPKTEADDVIALLAIELVGLDIQPIVVSTDNDYMQLLQIDPSVLVYSPVKDILYDQAKFQEQYGFPSDRMLEYKALVGDGSDNIGGVFGVGEKTAKQLISKSPSLSQLVQEQSAELMKSKKLARVVTEFDSIVVRNMKLMNLLDPCVESVEAHIADSLSALMESKVQNIEHSKVQRYLVSHSFNSMLKDFNAFISVFAQQVVRSRLGGL